MFEVLAVPVLLVEAHPAKNVRLATRIASFSIILLVAAKPGPPKLPRSDTADCHGYCKLSANSRGSQ
jgi:hypothetical protein